MIYNEYVDKLINELQNINSFNGKIKYANNNLQRIGSGSGRAVYNIDDKVVLKLAKNKKGIAQNEAEAGVGVYQDTQDIVTKIIDFDDNQHTWVLVEKAKKVTPNRIKELTEIPDLKSMFYYLKNIESINKGGGNIFRLDDDVVEELQENEFVQELVDLISNYSQSAGDMGRPSSYGEVIRYGQPTIVLTDYGINDEVYALHYSPNTQKQYQMYELYNFADGNDDILSDIGNTGEIRHGMWALMPYDVSDGDNDSVINEDFVHFVSNRDYYPSKPLSAMPFMVENFHECVNNIKEVLNVVEDKKKFYNNLLKLQEFLINTGWYNREPLKEIDNFEIEKNINETTDREIADKIANFVAKKYNSNPEFINSGTFGSAYDIGNNLVLKVTSDKSEANENLDLIGKPLKHIAQPYKVFSVKYNDKDYYVIILEKLKTDEPYFKRMYERLEYVFERIFGINYKDAFEAYVFGNQYIWDVSVDEIDNYFKKNPEDAEFFFSILKIMMELKKYNSSSNDFYNYENLGYKKDGSIGFFDVGFGDYFYTSNNKPEQIAVDEDGTALYSTDDNIGSDMFPNYNPVDTSPSIDNNLDANDVNYHNDSMIKIDDELEEDLDYNHVDDATQDEYIISERIKSAMKGSSSVKVKDKCKLGGLGNTSVACNQGDINNLEFGSISEHKQQMEKEYVKTNLFTPEDVENVLNITNGDAHTYKIARIYDLFQDITSKYNKRKSAESFKNTYAEKHLKELYDELKNYNKNVFPIENFESLHPLDLFTSLRNRKEVIDFLNTIPSQYLRNLKPDIRRERNSEYEMQYNLPNTIKSIKNLLKLVDRMSDEKKEKLMNKVFSSKNDTFEKVEHQLNNIQINYLSHNEGIEELRNKIEYEEDEAEKLYDDGSVVVVDVKSSDAMKNLGCGSQWCFATEYGTEHWGNYADNSHVQIVYNFSEDSDSYTRMVVVLPDGSVYNMYNEYMEDGNDYLDELGVLELIHKNSNEFADVSEQFKNLPPMNEIINEEINSNKLIQKAKQFENNYLNCELFVNLMTTNGETNVKKLPKVNFNEITIGDVIVFGVEGNIRHYAIYLGGDKVLEVEEWGGKPKINTLNNDLNKYESIVSIHRPQYNQLKETIDSTEALTDRGALNAMINGDKDASMISFRNNPYAEKVVKNYNYKTIPFEQKHHTGLDMRLVYKNTPESINKVKKLYEIIKKHGGYLKDKTPEEAREIGRLLDYSEESIEKFINKNYHKHMVQQEPSPDDYDDFDEGVGDKYLEKKHGFKPEFDDFDKKYQSHQNMENGEKIVYKDNYTTIIRNPKTLKNIGPNVRGIIDKHGNLYVEEQPNVIHNVMLHRLNDVGLINYITGWHKKIPTEFITVQRLSNTNVFYLGESNEILSNRIDRSSNMEYWKDTPTPEEVRPAFKEFLRKAKQKNPNIDFSIGLINDDEYDEDLYENNINERKLDMGWFAGSQVVDEKGNPLVVYHGTNQDFRRFNLKNAVQPIIWFSSDRDKIERGDAGAAGRSRIISAYLSIKKMAGWDEYEKYGLGELYEMGYDGAKLDDDYFVFSPKQIRIIDNGMNKNENITTFAENNVNNMDEAELMSLQDLPFKKEIEELGGKIFSVGGAVRDGFLGKESKDLDILITGVPFETLEKLLSKYGRVDAVGKSFGVLKFKPEGSTEDIDIAIPRTERPTGGGGHKDFEVSSDHSLPIEKDLERRDFTINAIAKDSNGNLVDPYGGQEDLKNKIIRAVNPDAFSDDPLRMLRAVQFASRFGFTIEPKTMQMIINSADMIKEIPAERIITEFDKIINKGNIRLGVQLLNSTNLFKNIFGFDIKQSTIDRSPFEEVKTMGEFIYLLTRLLPNPAEFYLGRFSTEDAKRDKTYREIKALDLAFDSDVTTPLKARSIAHNMYIISPLSLKSKIIPEQLENAANELLGGKYPKTTSELAVNGNDLMSIGLVGKEIGDVQRMLLLKVYGDKVQNNKEDLLNLARKNKPITEDIKNDTVNDWTNRIVEKLTSYYGGSEYSLQLFKLLSPIVKKAVKAKSFYSFDDFIGSQTEYWNEKNKFFSLLYKMLNIDYENDFENEYNNIIGLMDNIFDEEKESINESKDNKIEYGALMLTLNIPKWDVITSKIDKNDIYEVNGEFGIETYPHVTLLYGFTDDVNANEVFELYKDHFDLNEIKINVDKISIFETNDFDVVKFDVESSILNKINGVMKDLPNNETYPDYHPHITIAYVKKGEGKKYIKDFNKKYDLTGNELVFSTKDEKQTKLKLNKKEEMKESTNWDGNVLYSCVLLDEDSHNKLVKVFSPMIPDDWEVLAHHMTLNLGKIDPKYENDLGKEVILTVLDYGMDDKVMAVGVEGYPTNNKKPHVTIAVNRKNGGKPFMSNNLTDWKDIGFKFQLKGVVTEIKKSQPLQESAKKKSKYKNTQKSLMNSKNISKEMKEKISKYLTGGSTYHEGGRVHGLSMPNVLREKSNKANGVSMGADKNGFYVYTHRARSKSKPTPDGITVKEIEFIESTG